MTEFQGHYVNSGGEEGEERKRGAVAEV